MGFFDGIAGMFGSGDHSSVLGALGGKIQKFTDPIAMIPGVGDKWVNLTSNKLPGLVNSGLSKVVAPFDKIDETINPVRKIPIVDRVGDIVRDKPGDALGLVAGAVYGAPALAGALGGGGAGGGAVGSLGSSGGAVGGITAAPGVSLAGGGTALGSTAGMSGSFAPVLGGAGAFMGGASGVSAGTPMTGDVSGMSGTWQPVNQGFDWSGALRQGLNNMNRQQQQNQQQQQGSQSAALQLLQQAAADNRARQLAQALQLAQFNQQNRQVG